MRAAVIGAGAMGSGIAAQFANAGVPVLLLDIVPAGAARRNALAEGAIARQLKTGGFMHPDQASLVEPGNLEDDLDRLGDRDWIVEAIIEEIGLKRALYERIEQVRKDGSIVSSNTSTLQLAALTDRMPDRFRRDFAITHFFNPPRHMALLELVEPADIEAPLQALVREAAVRDLGKTVVECRDTPGFIANRIGCFWMSLAALAAIRAGLTVEQADAAIGAPFGIPRTGVFGLFDLVGIDLVPTVWGSLLRALPADDAHQGLGILDDPTFRTLRDTGRFGRKSGGGFYRQSGQGAARLREALDLATLEYRPEQPVTLKDELASLATRDDASGRYAWTVLSGLVCYAAEVAPEIADDVVAIDTAMRLGYGWSHGPFQLADLFGVSALADRLRQQKRAVPVLLQKAAGQGGFYPGHAALKTSGEPSPEAASRGLTLLGRVRQGGQPVSRNGSAALWDLGDGVACFELLTKMNVLDVPAQDALDAALDTVRVGFRALVIGSDHPRSFCSGGDLKHLLALVEQGTPGPLEQFISRGQATFRALLAAPFPVIGAGFGLALGGGCELLLHCDRIVAHAELDAGLTEARHGILPAWGGCVRMLRRAVSNPDLPGGAGPEVAASRAFATINGAATSGSALAARRMGILRASDRVVMSRSALLDEAKREALLLVATYRPEPPARLTVAGRSGHAELMHGLHQSRPPGAAASSAHDMHVASVTARVLTGGDADPAVPVSEDQLYDLERDALVELALIPESRARIAATVATGKPPRN